MSRPKLRTKTRVLDPIRFFADRSNSKAHVVYIILFCFLVLLQRGADPTIRNTDGKTALDLADPLSKSVLTGICIGLQRVKF